MHNVLSKISSIIIAGTNTEDNEMFDDVRSLSNRLTSYPKYPKERLLEIILNPRIIAKDIERFAEKCADFDFLSIRKQIMDDLEKKLVVDKEIIIMLRSFINQLLDNNERFHIHSVQSICKESKLDHSKNDLLQALYDKCQTFDLQYGYLNIFPREVLLKITKKNKSIAKTIINHSATAEEFKEMLYLCCVNFRKALNITKLVQVLSKTEEPRLHYLASLPEPIIDVLLQGIDFHKKCCRLSFQRIEEVLNIYNQKYELFMSVKAQPLLAKLIMTHSNIDIMNSFLDVIAINNKKISEIHTFNSNLSSFLFSHLSGHTPDENIEAQTLIDLSKTDPKRCNIIISNAPIIKQMNISIKEICELAKENSRLFDDFFKNSFGIYENDLTLIKKRKIFREKFISKSSNMIRYN